MISGFIMFSSPLHAVAAAELLQINATLPAVADQGAWNALSL